MFCDSCGKELDLGAGQLQTALANDRGGPIDRNLFSRWPVRYGAIAVINTDYLWQLNPW
jgi:hypothetical protein